MRDGSGQDASSDSSVYDADALAVWDGATDAGTPVDIGITDDAGMSGRRASEFEVDVSDAMARPCDFVIRSDDDWDRINEPELEVFCVAPGDYSERGSVIVRSSGELGSGLVPRFRVLRLEAPGLGHPVDLPNAERAVAPRIRFEGASFWLVSRLSFRHPTDEQLVLRHGSSDNVLDRLDMRGETDSMRRFMSIYTECDRNVVQNSIFGGQMFASDYVCLALHGRRTYGQIHDTHIVQNEFVNCTDGIQLVDSAVGGTYGTPGANFEGTLIDHNDIYLTLDYYVNCETGELDPSGWCACAENAIDIKSGSDSAVNPVIISNNVLYGFRDTFEGGDCGTSSSSWGSLIGVHNDYVDNLQLVDNVFFDSPGGYKDASLIHDASSARIVSGNLFHTMHRMNVAGNTGDALLMLQRDSSVQWSVRDNIFVDVQFFLGARVRRLVFAENILVNAGTRRIGFTDATLAEIHHNRWWGTERPAVFEGEGDEVGTLDHSRLIERCVRARRWSEPSFELCLHHGGSTE